MDKYFNCRFCEKEKPFKDLMGEQLLLSTRFASVEQCCYSCIDKIPDDEASEWVVSLVNARKIFDFTKDMRDRLNNEVSGE